MRYLAATEEFDFLYSYSHKVAWNLKTLDYCANKAKQSQCCQLATFTVVWKRQTATIVSAHPATNEMCCREID